MVIRPNGVWSSKDEGKASFDPLREEHGQEEDLFQTRALVNAVTKGVLSSVTREAETNQRNFFPN